jgi:hypothetical protein
MKSLSNNETQAGSPAAKRVKIAEKVDEPSFGVNVINFELNRFNASI